MVEFLSRTLGYDLHCRKGDEEAQAEDEGGRGIRVDQVKILVAHREARNAAQIREDAPACVVFRDSDPHHCCGGPQCLTANTSPA